METYRETINNLICELNEEEAQVVISLLRVFIKRNIDPHKTAVDGKRYIIGIADGKYEVPDDIDEMNDEIAEMFGVA